MRRNETVIDFIIPKELIPYYNKHEMQNELIVEKEIIQNVLIENIQNEIQNEFRKKKWVKPPKKNKKVIATDSNGDETVYKSSYQASKGKSLIIET